MGNKLYIYIKYLFFVVLIALSILTVSSCTHTIDDAFPTTEICVFSDPHYFDPDLWTSGTAFENYLANGRKLIAESEEILISLIQLILSEDAEIVIFLHSQQ